MQTMKKHNDYTDNEKKAYDAAFEAALAYDIMSAPTMNKAADGMAAAAAKAVRKFVDSSPATTCIVAKVTFYASIIKGN